MTAFLPNPILLTKGGLANVHCSGIIISSNPVTLRITIWGPDGGNVVTGDYLVGSLTQKGNKKEFG